MIDSTVTDLTLKLKENIQGVGTLHGITNFWVSIVLEHRFPTAYKFVSAVNGCTCYSGRSLYQDNVLRDLLWNNME